MCVYVLCLDPDFYNLPPSPPHSSICSFLGPLHRPYPHGRHGLAFLLVFVLSKGHYYVQGYDYIHGRDGGEATKRIKI